MPVDPKLLIKAAKVYEAAEPVEGEKPKEVYESHKKCAPGEFGMNKEGAGTNSALYKAIGARVPQSFLPNVAAPAQQRPQQNIFSKLQAPTAPKTQDTQQNMLNKLQGGVGKQVPSSFLPQLPTKAGMFGMNKEGNDFSTWLARDFPVAVPASAALYGAVGSGIGAAQAKPGKKLRGAGRGFARGAGVALGGQLGSLGGMLAGQGLGKLLPGGKDPHNDLAQALLGLTGAGLGAAGGMYGGYHAGGAAADALGLKDDDKEEKKSAHEKVAIPVFGGKNYSLAPRGFGLGLKGGYNFIGGLVPNPYVGIDVGTPHTGLSLSGPLPAIGYRNGFFTRPPGATSGDNAHGILGRKSLWGYIADTYSGKTPDALEDEHFDESLKRLQHVTKDELHEAVPHYHTGEDGKPLSKKMHGALVNYYHEKSRPDVDKDTSKSKKDKKMKKESAFVFGTRIKTALNPELGYGAAGGGLLGAGLGGLAGFINPGEEEDEDGRTRQRSRFGAALRGALGGGALGAAGGAALGHFAPGHVNSLMGMFNSKKPAGMAPKVGPDGQMQTADQYRRMLNNNLFYNGTTENLPNELSGNYLP